MDLVSEHQVQVKENQMRFFNLNLYIECRVVVYNWWLNPSRPYWCTTFAFICRRRFGEKNPWTYSVHFEKSEIVCVRLWYWKHRLTASENRSTFFFFILFLGICVSVTVFTKIHNGQYENRWCKSNSSSLKSSNWQQYLLFPTKFIPWAFG